MSNRILVIEDEEKIARLLQLELTHAGYLVELASDGSEGLRKALNDKWDLILLDILLPVFNGFELIKSFRKKNSETPIIVVTACDTPSDIVNGLDLGSQDYITKPFHLEELLARIRACMRRQNQFQQTDDELNKHDSMIYTVKGTNVNLRSREVLQNDIKIDFTPKEFELLVYLIEHQNEILSREQIMNDVWGYDFLGNSNLVDVYIRYVRKKLLAPYPNIRTIRGVGYLLEV
ncbi:MULTISPECIES: response regulator transcription factor [Paenibacillus]|uniref:Response regulator transcription factor n=1 Tax=Paenibacillus violae TaxID=3077234 RepID=A0ABU3RBV0_9BACL|nr:MULTISPECIES: response regulator transcription factor [Paenibacillus]MDU0201731.1 response regulator transcription factor [Paenibacillus sp. PFR10]MEC0268882.1 response regulator transcription factor [Paenibacillus anseongense]